MPLDIYDEDGGCDQGKVVAALEAILRRTNHGLTSFQRNDLIELLDECSAALPGDHECIGEDEAEHMHDVMMWERQWGKRSADQLGEDMVS